MPQARLTKLRLQDADSPRGVSLIGMDLNGKKFAVIGGSGVLGSTLAAALTAAGGDVHLIVRDAARIPGHRQHLPHAVADIRDRASLVGALSSLGGQFDGIINTAGVVAFGSIDEVPAEAVEQLFDTNSMGTINALAASRTHVNKGGVFASFTGVAADMAVLGMSAYCASKAAAKMAMSVAAREFRRAGIRVLDIRAPHTETGLVDRAVWGTAPKMPAGKTPDEVVARVVAAIAADETDLPVDAFA